MNSQTVTSLLLSILVIALCLATVAQACSCLPSSEFTTKDAVTSTPFVVEAEVTEKQEINTADASPFVTVFKLEHVKICKAPADFSLDNETMYVQTYNMDSCSSGLDVAPGQRVIVLASSPMMKEYAEAGDPRHPQLMLCTNVAAAQMKWENVSSYCTATSNSHSAQC